MTWLIYYADGSTFSSEDGYPHDVPRWGVQYIAQSNGDPCWNADYYIWHDGKQQWLDVDLIGLLDWLVTDAELITVVCVGRRIPKAEWKAIMARVNADGKG